jgi:hypothetical protein
VPDSQRKVAAEMCVSQSVLSYAAQHLDAVKRYPELEADDVTRAEALRLWKAWEAMAPTNRSRARKTWRARQQEKQDRAAMPPEEAKKRPRVKAPRPRKSPTRRLPSVSVQVRLTRTWYVFTAGLMQVINDFERSGGLAPLLAAWTPEEWGRANGQLQNCAAQRVRITRELEAGMPKGTQTEGLRVIRGQVE